VLVEEPIVLFLSAYNEGQPAPPGPEVQPGVFVVQGPSRVVASAASARTGDIVIDAFALAALLAMVGIGWSVALAPGNLLARTGLAMAFGSAALAVAGTVAGRLGVPLQGASGTALVLAVAVGGWVVKFSGHRRLDLRHVAARCRGSVRPETAERADHQESVAGRDPRRNASEG
jgi:hypothetical protein